MFCTDVFGLDSPDLTSSLNLERSGVAIYLVVVRSHKEVGKALACSKR
jgi:hypothetical protein